MSKRQVKTSTGTNRAVKSSGEKAKYVQRPAKPAAPVEERLPKLYRALSDQIDDGYMTNAIKTCKKILSLDQKSDAAFKTLLFLLLETDAYAAALELVESTIASQSRGNLEFEKAYCLYRLHKEEDSLKIVEGAKGSVSGDDKIKWEHLEAQINYRLGSYQAAQHIFEDLLATCSSTSAEHPDLVTNLNATSQRLEFTNSGYHSYTATTSVDDLEANVPTLPAGWSTRPVASVPKAPVASSSTSKPVTAPPKKPKHALPKGAKPGATITEDPDRWLPYKQRASTAAALAAASGAGKKKKGGKEGMGTGMTQGSVNDAPSTSQGGGNKKKGKKGR